MIRGRILLTSGALIAVAFATLGTTQSVSAATKVVYSRNNVVVSTCKTSYNTKFYIRNYSGTGYGTIAIKTSFYSTSKDNYFIGIGLPLPAYYGNVTALGPKYMLADSYDVVAYSSVTKNLTYVVARFNLPSWSNIPVC